ncbi:MAG: XdhC family protein [Lentisphaeria bacterium]|nr:XdhC family protein [Lentisphaeria bacterium]
MIDKRIWTTAFNWIEARIPFIFSVIFHTEGSTPRKQGAIILVAKDQVAGTIGGGAVELKLIQMLRKQLKERMSFSELDLRLDGTPDNTELGVCGGIMTFRNYRFESGQKALCREVLLAYETANSCTISFSTVQAPILAQDAQSNHNIKYNAPVNLIIYGGGHCGKALAEAASLLKYRITIVDPQKECQNPNDYPENIHFSSMDTSSIVWGERNAAVLLTRNWRQDAAILTMLKNQDCTYIGMMGSQKRIACVKELLTDGSMVKFLEGIHCPIGLPIPSETPEEIAIAILAEVMQEMHL